MSRFDNPESLNLLLQRLSPDVKSAVRQQSQLVHLDLREEVIKPEKSLQFVDFPIYGVMSYLQPMGNNKLIEIANIGREGIVGAHAALGNAPLSAICFCQVEVAALRLDIDSFLQLLKKHSQLAELCRLYGLTLLDQIGRNIGCNGTHSILQRCAKWLLLTHDRCHHEDFHLTQEYLAKMLNVVRAAVNRCEGKLSEDGLIKYSRGKIQILNREGLEKVACSCYQDQKNYFEEILNNFV